MSLALLFHYLLPFGTAATSVRVILERESQGGSGTRKRDKCNVRVNTRS